MKNGEASLKGYNEYIKTTNNSIGIMGIKAKVSAIKMAALNVILSTGIALLASFAINKIITAIDNFIHREEKIAEKAEIAKDNIDELKNSFDELESSVNDVKERYAELSQYIDQTNGKNSSLSTDEYQEFLDLSNQLAELFPSLIKSYDENGNAILNLSGDVDTVVASLDELIQKEREATNQEMLKNLPDVYKDLVNKDKKAKEALEKANSSADIINDLINSDGWEKEDGGYTLKINTDIDINDIIEEVNKAVTDAGYKITDYSSAGYDNGDGTKYFNIGFGDNLKDGDSIQSILSEYLETIYGDVDTYIEKIKAQLDDFKQYLYIYFSTEPEFTKLSDDPELQQTIQNLVYKTDWREQAKDEVNTDEWSKELENWLTDNYVDAIANIDDEEIKDSLSQLFDPDISVDDLLELATKIQQYFKDNDIKIPLDFILNGDTNGTVQNTKNSLDNNLKDISNGNLDEYKNLEEYTRGFSVDQVNTWLKVTKGAKNATEAIETYKAKLQDIQSENSSNFLNSKDNIEAIDNYKEKISDLSGYLEKINSNHKLSAEEMIELNTTYGISADSVEEYKEKIVELMNDTASNSEIMTALADAIANCNDEAIKSQLQSLYDNLQNINKEAQNSASSFGDLDTAISTLQNKAQLLRDINEIKDIGIDAGNLNEIISLYPELTEKVAEYNTGLITSQQLFDALTEVYEIDVKNYAIAVGEKLKYDEQFYDNVVNNIPSWLKDLAESYGIDFNNYKNLCESKLSLDKRYAQKKLILSRANAELDASYDKVDNSSGNERVDAEYAAQIAKQKQIIAQRELDDIQKIIDGLDTTLSTTLDLDTNWNSFGLDRNNGGSDKDKAKQEIDWLSQSLTVLQAEVDKLQTTLDNTTGVKNQIAAIDNLNGALKNLKTGYKSAYDGYKDRYNKALKSLGGKGKSIKNKIESGKAFDLKEYDSETAEKIQAAIDAYNSMMETGTKIDEIEKQIQDNKYIEKSKYRQQDYENQLETINTLLEDQTLSASDKNKLLDKQLELQKSINNELRKQAKYSGDYETIDKLNQEDKNNKLQTKLDKIQNNQDENQKLIDRYKEQLEDTTLSSDEINELNKKLQNVTNDDFKYQIEKEITKIDPNVWKKYITKLKKKYKETDVSDEKFINNHLEEIFGHFDNTDLSKIYQEYLNSQINFREVNYEAFKTTRGYKIQANENNIADIKNAIESQDGRGTQDQYTRMQQLYKSNLEYLEQQRIEAKLILVNVEEGTEEWNKWNNELQECEDNIAKCNQDIKDCNVSILSLPLNDVEDALDEISRKLKIIDKQISDKDTLISAAIALIDDQIEGYELLKESNQDQIDALQEEKSLREANLSVQKAEWELEKARNQRSSKIYREGVGFVYESDMDAINEAQKNYDETLFNRKITLLEHQNNLYDDEIKKLNDIKKQWTDMVDDIQDMINLNEALTYDTDFIQKVLSNDYSLIASISGEYRNLLETKSNYEDQQEDYEELKDQINEVIKLYEREEMVFTEANRRIISAIQTYFPEILTKYQKESSEIENIMDNKIEDSEISSLTNEEMLESYTFFLKKMQNIFKDLSTILEGFKGNTFDMSNSVKAALSSIQSEIQSTINAMNSISSIKSSSISVGAVAGIKLGSTGGINLKTVGKSHSGMELGTIRKNMNNGSGSNSDFKALCLSELESDEILRVLKVGENVLTSDQTNNIMANFKNLASIKIPTLPLRNQEIRKSVEFNGDIVIQGVQDVNGLSRAIKNQLPSAFLQELYK